MDRKKFIKTCGLACLGATSISTLLQSCISTKMISAPISGENLIIALADFNKSKEENGFREYLIVQNDQLQFPIYIYRFNENDYSALYLRCSHQGNEVNAYGEKLVCSAHGSEFDNLGNATHGPAESKLTSFPVSTDDQNLIISLKAL